MGIDAVKKPSKKVRKRQIQIYVSEDEDEQLEWAATEIGIPKASYVRMVALKDAKEVIS